MEDEEIQEKAFKQQRMDMLIKLKGSITANKVRVTSLYVTSLYVREAR